MTKNFTKLSVLCLIACVSFSACKKSSDNKPTSDTFSMKFTANSTAVSYSSCVVADVQLNSTSYAEIIGLNEKTPDNSLQLELITGVASLKAGQTYPVSANYLGANSALLMYSPDGTNYFTSQIENPVGSVTITSVTSTTLKGTFTGKLYGADDYDAADLKYTITGGTFVAEMPK